MFGDSLGKEIPWRCGGVAVTVARDCLRPRTGETTQCPQARRCYPGGTPFHLLNRGNDRQTLFHTPGDYEAFIRVVKETLLIVSQCVPAWWSGRKIGCGAVPGLTCTQTTAVRYHSLPRPDHVPRIG